MPEVRETRTNYESLKSDSDQNRSVRSDTSSNEHVIRAIEKRHPDWPHLNLMIYFSSHRTAEDVTGIKGHLRGKDIFFYEQISGDGLTRFLQMASDSGDKISPEHFEQILADNNISLKKPVRGTILETMLDSLNGSRIIVGHNDLREEDRELLRKIYKIDSSHFVDSSFNKTLDNLRKRDRRIANLNSQREQIMVKRFEKELQEIMTSHPELKHKKELNILMIRGGAHTPLAHKFITEGVDTSYKFSHNPYIYGYYIQALRSFAFGQEPSRDILARAYLEHMLRGVLGFAKGDKTISTHQLSSYLLLMSSQFTTSEIEEIHKMCFKYTTQIERKMEICRKNRNPATEKELYDTIHSEIDAFDALLTGKNLNPLPRNEQELNQQLDHYKKQKIGVIRTLPAEEKSHTQQHRPIQKPAWSRLLPEKLSKMFIK